MKTQKNQTPENYNNSLIIYKDVCANLKCMNQGQIYVQGMPGMHWHTLQSSPSRYIDLFVKISWRFTGLHPCLMSHDNPKCRTTVDPRCFTCLASRNLRVTFTSKPPHRAYCPRRPVVCMVTKPATHHPPRASDSAMAAAEAESDQSRTKLYSIEANWC